MKFYLYFPLQVLWIFKQRRLTCWKPLARFPSWITSTLRPKSFFLRYSWRDSTGLNLSNTCWWCNSGSLFFAEQISDGVVHQGHRPGEALTPALADVGTVRGCNCLCCGVVSDLNQDVVQVQLDAGCQGMSRLIHDQLFLTSMVHALEEQKNFSIKEKSVWRLDDDFSKWLA